MKLGVCFLGGAGGGDWGNVEFATMAHFEQASLNLEYEVVVPFH